MNNQHNSTSGRPSQRYYINHLRKVFAEREKDIRARVRANHRPHLDFLETRGITLENLRDVSARKVATGALAGAMVLTPISGMASVSSAHTPTHLGSANEIVSIEDAGYKLAAELKKVVPAGSENLSAAQEQQVSKIFSEVLNLKATPEISGKRLNRTFGLIGAEQHLYRFPGDTIFDHAATPSDFAMYGGSGIAPGLGAYGYWARSRESLTPEMEQQEKWYVVAQTFLAPGFKENPGATAKFFQYRKFLVVNPDSGQAIVGDLGDAGPAEYTGKVFGGSPEVMHYLGYGGGPRKGRVIFYFLDDPQNKIPLGPISAKIAQGK